MSKVVVMAVSVVDYDSDDLKEIARDMVLVVLVVVQQCDGAYGC